MDKTNMIYKKESFKQIFKIFLLLLIFVMIAAMIAGRENWRTVLPYVLSLTLIVVLVDFTIAYFFPDYIYRRYLKEKTFEEKEKKNQESFFKGKYLIFIGILFLVFGSILGYRTSHRTEVLAIISVGLVIAIMGLFHLKNAGIPIIAENKTKIKSEPAKKRKIKPLKKQQEK